jgi:hypothetical protein
MTLQNWGRFGVAQIRNRAVASNCLHQSPDVEAYGNLDPYARAPRFIGWSAFGNVAPALSAVNVLRQHAGLGFFAKEPEVAGQVPPARRHFRKSERRACRAFDRRLAATALKWMRTAARLGEFLVRRVG